MAVDNTVYDSVLYKSGCGQYCPRFHAVFV